MFGIFGNLNDSCRQTSHTKRQFILLAVTLAFCLRFLVYVAMVHWNDISTYIIGLWHSINIIFKNADSENVFIC